MKVKEIDEEIMMEALQSFFDEAVDANFKELTPLERSIYVIFDIVTLCQNGGISPWIYYHGEDSIMLQAAFKAFNDIGHPEASKVLTVAYALHLEDPEHDLKLWHSMSDYFFEHPGELYLGAYNLLVEENGNN